MEHKCPLCGEVSENAEAAERKLTRLIKAGDRMRNTLWPSMDGATWDAAVAEVRGE